MKIQELIETKQRLDAKCWKGYKKQGTKMKGDTRVNNCVPESADQGVAEVAGPAVDSKGRTQRQWIQAVKAKFPDAKIIQSKMIDGPCQATLTDGRTLVWKKIDQVEEIIDPTGATANALRYVGRKIATVFPLLAVGGVGAGLAYAGLMAPIVASMGGVGTALAGLSTEVMAYGAVGGMAATPSLIQIIKDLFAADENSIQAGIKRWVEKHVGDENDVLEFMNLHAQNAYLKQRLFRWRAKQWEVKMKPDEAEAYLEKNNKHWLDMEKQKVIDAEKAKVDAAKAEVKPGMAENIDADQKKARQVPSTEMPKKTSPVLGKAPKQHPFKGRAVGGSL